MTNQRSSNPHAPASVPPHLAPILVALARDWTPEPLHLGRVEALRHDNRDLTALEPLVELRDDNFVVTFGGGEFRANLDALLPIKLDVEVRGECVGGLTFSAKAFSRASMSNESLTLETDDWLAVVGEPPSIWIGRIDGTLGVYGGGNLIVERRTDDRVKFGSSGHFHFRGSYTYYLIRTGDRTERTWYLVVDTGAGAPDIELLAADFLLLQFVFGRTFCVPAFLGINGLQQTVASLNGTGERRTLHTHSFPPVPIERNNTERIHGCWVSLIFERISGLWSVNPIWRPPFYLALKSYLDAMTLHVDADYLRLHIALEAFAYWVLRTNGQSEQTVVKSKSEWKKWVKQHEPAIRALATSGFEDMLYNGVLGAYRHPSGRVVANAFLNYGTPLSPEMTAELTERGTIVHQGLMSPQGYDADRELRRIAIVRTMLVALLARVSGYGGSINGWDTGDQGYSLEPVDWWRASAADQELARQTFLAIEKIDTTGDSK